MTATVAEGASPVAPARAEPIMVLSLWQPWASLWVAGEKLIETRGWSTSYRGRIAVHASKRFDRDQERTCAEAVFDEALARIGLTHRAQMPLGCLLGWVTLVDCALMVEGLRESSPGKLAIDRDPRVAFGTNEHAFGNYDRGRYAWITDGRRRVLPKPIPFKGSQGLRGLPADVARELNR